MGGQRRSQRCHFACGACLVRNGDQVRAGRPGAPLSFPLPLTQADFGDATGLTNVHVNRTLKELRDRSAVELRMGVVTIHDWNQLVRVGDFDAGFLLLHAPSPRITEAA
jgi:hypothetical protein